MNCEHCLNPYDHSKRKPFIISCPHRFCSDCIGHKLNDKKLCPICHKPIRSKFPDLTLMKVLPYSTYDNTRRELENCLHETNELRLKQNNLCEKKFSASLTALKNQRAEFAKKSNDLINLIKKCQTNFLLDLDQVENKLQENLKEIKTQSEIESKVKVAKTVLETNELNETQLITLKDEFHNKKIEFTQNIEKVDRMNEFYDIIYNNNINVQTGVIASLKESANKVCYYFSILLFHVNSDYFNLYLIKYNKKLISIESQDQQVETKKTQKTPIMKTLKENRFVFRKETPKKRKLN